MWILGFFKKKNHIERYLQNINHIVCILDSHFPRLFLCSIKCCSLKWLKCFRKFFIMFVNSVSRCPAVIWTVYSIIRVCIEIQDNIL